MMKQLKIDMMFLQANLQVEREHLRELKLMRKQYPSKLLELHIVKTEKEIELTLLKIKRLLYG